MTGDDAATRILDGPWDTLADVVIPQSFDILNAHDLFV